KEREQKFTLWKSETDIFVTELGKRVQARQSFEAQFGQGGLAGNSSTKGLRESFDLQNSIQNSATSPSRSARGLRPRTTLPGASRTSASAPWRPGRTSRIVSAEPPRSRYRAREDAPVGRQHGPRVSEGSGLHRQNRSDSR